MRIGVARYVGDEIGKAILAAFKGALGSSRGAGATVVDDTDLAGLREYDSLPEHLQVSC